MSAMRSFSLPLSLSRVALAVIALLACVSSVAGVGCGPSAPCSTNGDYCSSGNCIPAEIGYYANGDGLYKTACPDAYSTQSTGSINVSACDVCNIGYFSAGNNQPGSQTTDCLACNGGTTTSGTGTRYATLCNLCLPGYGAAVSGTATNNDCAVCAAGKYSAATADADCIACATGTATSGTTAADHNDVSDCISSPSDTAADTAADDKLPKDTVAITTVGVVLAVGVIGAVAYSTLFATQASANVVTAAGNPEKHAVELVANAEEA